MGENLSELICCQPPLLQLEVRKTSQVRRICVVKSIVEGEIVWLNRLQYCECSGWFLFVELDRGFYAGQEEILNWKLPGKSLADRFRQFLRLLRFSCARQREGGKNNIITILTFPQGIRNQQPGPFGTSDLRFSQSTCLLEKGSVGR